ncbi:hypothetical protein [Tuwongella immobilis]|uniref:hypothetical protein n=1 Tax=Tuwongella immobilis TaxID=692036 RepID=UPI0013A69745|nr:hypothetical protein [Tuwongella immobilis]
MTPRWYRTPTPHESTIPHQFHPPESADRIPPQPAHMDRHHDPSALADTAIGCLHDTAEPFAGLQLGCAAPGSASRRPERMMRRHADDAIAADQAQVVDFPLAVAESTHHQTTATWGNLGARLDCRHDRIALGSAGKACE